MAEEISLRRQAQIGSYEQLTAEQKAKLQSQSNTKKLDNDSGFADGEEEEDAVDQVDSCPQQPREDPAISQVAQNMADRLNLKSHGITTSSSTCTQEDRPYDQQAHQYAQRVRDSVTNWEINEDGDTLLHVGIIHRNTYPRNMAEFAIHCAPDSSYLDCYNKLRQTALNLAVYLQDSKIVRALLDKGARIDLPDRSGRLPLHVACGNGDVGCVTELTRAVHDPQFAQKYPHTQVALSMTVNSTNYDGFTALQVAARGGFKNIVQYLVDRCGADVDFRDARSGRTALHHAVELKDLDMVSHLVMRCQANKDATTLDESTPLHLSTAMGLHGITNFLIAAGADTTLENLDGELPSFQ